jgi:Ca2+/Na+ antiporter
MYREVEHTVATEILIIVSQSIFFVFLFVILKYGIVDRQGWMNDKEKIRENAIPLIAIYFAILTMIGILMIPLQNYEYGHMVLIISSILILLIFLYDFRKVYYDDDKFKLTSSSIDNASRKLFSMNKTKTIKKDTTASSKPKSKDNQSSDGFDF